MENFVHEHKYYGCNVDALTALFMQSQQLLFQVFV